MYKMKLALMKKGAIIQHIKREETIKGFKECDERDTSQENTGAQRVVNW